MPEKSRWKNSKGEFDDNGILSGKKSLKIVLSLFSILNEMYQQIVNNIPWMGMKQVF